MQILAKDYSKRREPQDYKRNLAKPADEAVFGRAFFQEIDD